VWETDYWTTRVGLVAAYAGGFSSFQGIVRQAPPLPRWLVEDVSIVVAVDDTVSYQTFQVAQFNTWPFGTNHGLPGPLEK